MIKEEITSGLRQAIERGYSLEQAKQSFINAGYNSKDIEDSASSLGGLLTSMPEIAYPQRQQEEKSQEIQNKQIPQINIQTQQLPQFPQPKKSKLKIIIIILVILLLILIAAFISSLLFKDKIIEFLKGIFSSA
jgi:hypothetical protein